MDKKVLISQVASNGTDGQVLPYRLYMGSAVMFWPQMWRAVS